MGPPCHSDHQPGHVSLHRCFTKGHGHEGGRFHGAFWLTMHREDRYRFLRLGNSFNRIARRGSPLRRLRTSITGSSISASPTCTLGCPSGR